MKTKSASKDGFLRALGLVAYFLLIATIMNSGDKIFGKLDTPLAGATLLLLVVLSAIITGGLILACPLALYLDGKKRHAHNLLVATIAWLGAFLIFALVLLALRGGK